MNRSTNAIDGPLNATIKISKQEDGTFVAQPIGKTGDIVGPIAGRSESEATNLCKQALQRAAGEGKI